MSDGTTGSVAPPVALADAPEEVVRAMGGRRPTLQQWEAITHPLSPCAVVAGAGSGKTAVMAARVVYLVLVRQGRIEGDHDGALPSDILCLTFTNKAAEELAHRVRRATEALGLPEGEEPTVMTYHAFAARLLDDFGLRMGLEPGPMLLTEAHRWQLASSLLADREFQHLEVRTVGHVVGEMLWLSDQCANHLVDPEEVIQHGLGLEARQEIRRASDSEMVGTARKRVELAAMVAEYRRRKRGARAIDYGDQIELAHGLVEAHPEVAERFRERFPVVLLDEYQDTNVAQARLLQTLCGRGYPVFAVGDPDQSIYAWRGASLRNILRFNDDFGLGGRRAERPLYVNFRSGSRILDVANRVIGEVPPERQAPGKVLVPHPDRGEGRVLAFVAADQLAEARHLAALVAEEAARRTAVDGEPPWQDFAVLCRKKRLFPPIVQALADAGIPAEVVDLGGLLQLPEVVDVVAWLRVLDDPARNVALARLLRGPRWRIGYRDLRALADWSARRTGALRRELDEDRPGDVRFALAEALDHLGGPGIVGLSDEATERLLEFREVLSALREDARGALPDVVAAILERSGLLPELEASPHPAARSARRNLLNFLQHVASFSPVESESSLSTLVTYLDVAEDAEESDLEPVQLSEANTVKLLTIHKAKGLEWPVVLVPGLAEHPRYPASSLFPDVSRQPNPIKRAATLPFELRKEEDLPRYEGNLKAFEHEVRERGLEEERRLCYVALTRARDLLVVSAAHWYEGPKLPHVPGRFFEEVVGHASCQTLFREDPPEENPLIEARRARAATWPGPDRDDDVDDLFPEGWHRAAERAVSEEGWAERRAEEVLSPTEVRELREGLAAHRERAALIAARTTPDRAPAIPSSLSVSGLVDYARCPKLFYWSVVRPLPRRVSQAARLGSEVHRWIELESRGQATLIDLDEAPDLATDERLGEPGDEALLKEAFRTSRFAGRVPLFAERPFLLYVDGLVVGGRVDAIFGEPDGPWEVVDYKTGRMPEPGDPTAGLQLDLYALACVDVWGKRPEDVTLTYLYLREGVEVTRPAGDVEAVRARVRETLAGIAGARFEPTPSDRCEWCDFLAFCDAGRRFLGR